MHLRQLGLEMGITNHDEHLGSERKMHAGSDGGSLLLMVRDEEVLRTIEIMRAVTIEMEDVMSHELVMSQMQDDVFTKKTPQPNAS
jgi:hypothetical protein